MHCQHSLDVSQIIFQSNDDSIVVQRMEHLQTLKLDNNYISNVTEQVGHLRHLTDLSLTHNNLAELYVDFSEMAALKRLDLSHNKFRRVPHRFKTIHPNLEAIDLSHNQIEDLSSEVLPHLKTLKRLNLSHNKLKAVPDTITELGSIEKIILRDNPELFEWPFASRSMPNIDFEWKSLLVYNAPMEQVLYNPLPVAISSARLKPSSLPPDSEPGFRARGSKRERESKDSLVNTQVPESMPRQRFY
jgi:hypothetical protein